MLFKRFHQRIQHKTRDRSAAPVLIVALGDSVTQGIGGVDEIYHEQVYHAIVKQRLEKTYPLCTFSMINAGVDGDRAEDGLARLDRDVIRHQPDLVILAFGLNDAALGGNGGLNSFKSVTQRLCQRIRDETPADIILLTCNMMLTRENDDVPDCWRHLTHDFLRLQNSGLLAAYARAIVEVGETSNVPAADLYAEWQKLGARGIDTTAMLSNGLNHPNPEGHRLAADMVCELLMRSSDT